MGNHKRKKKKPIPTTEVTFYSFWRPDPIPKKGEYTNLHPIASIGKVTENLLKIPKMTGMTTSPSLIGGLPIIRLLWQKGVALHFREEHSTPYVLNIGAVSTICDRKLYILYVQMYEHLGVTLFDEITQRFLMPKDFRLKVLDAGP